MYCFPQYAGRGGTAAAAAAAGKYVDMELYDSAKYMDEEDEVFGSQGGGGQAVPAALSMTLSARGNNALGASPMQSTTRMGRLLLLSQHVRFLPVFSVQSHVKV